jgi:hypothetical protein
MLDESRISMDRTLARRSGHLAPSDGLGFVRVASEHLDGIQSLAIRTARESVADLHVRVVQRRLPKRTRDEGGALR